MQGSVLHQLKSVEEFELSLDLFLPVWHSLRVGDSWFPGCAPMLTKPGQERGKSHCCSKVLICTSYVKVSFLQLRTAVGCSKFAVKGGAFTKMGAGRACVLEECRGHPLNNGSFWESSCKDIPQCG